jgi:hypothetical protein
MFNPLVVNDSFGPELTSVLSIVVCAVTVISSINFAWEVVGAATDATCLLLVKFSDLNVEQLLNKTIPKVIGTIAGILCLTIRFLL